MTSDHATMTDLTSAYLVLAYLLLTELEYV